MTPQQKQAILAVAGALLETVQAAGPHGAPAGPMYVAVMSHGIGLEALAGKKTKTKTNTTTQSSSD